MSPGLSEPAFLQALDNSRSGGAVGTVETESSEDFHELDRPVHII